MKITNWIKPYDINYWKNTRTRDEIGIRKADNLYITYVKIYSQMFKRIDISKRLQTLINAQNDAIIWMRKNK